MQKVEDFNEFIKIIAIAIYLRSFGYKAKVCNNSMSVQIEDVNSNMHSICTWDTAREFIKVRSQA